MEYSHERRKTIVWQRPWTAAFRLPDRSETAASNSPSALDSTCGRLLPNLAKDTRAGHLDFFTTSASRGSLESRP